VVTEHSPAPRKSPPQYSTTGIYLRRAQPPAIEQSRLPESPLTEEKYPMARIEIPDLPANVELTQREQECIAGGRGGGGNDVLLGGAGNDVVTGAPASSHINPYPGFLGGIRVATGDVG
jgi:hypothetical protein